MTKTHANSDLLLPAGWHRLACPAALLELLLLLLLLLCGCLLRRCRPGHHDPPLPRPEQGAKGTSQEVGGHPR